MVERAECAISVRMPSLPEVEARARKRTLAALCWSAVGFALACGGGARPAGTPDGAARDEQAPIVLRFEPQARLRTGLRARVRVDGHGSYTVGLLSDTRRLEGAEAKADQALLGGPASSEGAMLETRPRTLELRRLPEAARASDGGEPVPSLDEPLRILDRWSPLHHRLGVSLVRSLAPQGDALPAVPRPPQPMMSHRFAALLDWSQQVEFPPAPMPPGRSWSSEEGTVVVPGLGGLRVAATYHAQPSAGDTVTIVAEYRLRLRERPVAHALLLTSDGSGTGRFLVARSTGQIVRAEVALALIQSVQAPTTIAARRETLLSLVQEAGVAAWPQVPAPPRLPPAPAPLPECGDDLAALRHLIDGRNALVLKQLAGLDVGHAPELARAGVGQPIGQPGPVLILPRTAGERAMLDGRPIREQDAARELGKLLSGRRTLYLLAAADTNMARVKAWLARLPAGLSLAALVRSRSTGSAPRTAPARAAWLEQTLRELDRLPSGSSRHHQHLRLLRGLLTLCPDAHEALGRATYSQEPDAGLDALHPAVAACGCRVVDVPALTASLSTFLGERPLQAVPLPRKLPDRGKLADVLARLGEVQ